jgi:uncharacterized membrane protein
MVYNNLYKVDNVRYNFSPNYTTNQIFMDIKDDTVIEQSFVCSENNFSGVGVKFNTFSAHVDNEILVSLKYATSSAPLIEWSVTEYKIENNAFHYFTFEPLSDSRGKEFIITIRYKGVTVGETVAPMYSSDPLEYPDGQLAVDGADIPGVLAFTQVFAKANATSTFNKAIFWYIIITLVALFFCWKLKKDIVKIFFPVVMIIGLTYMVTTPIFRGQDETLHFYRAYEISLGHVTSDFSDGVGGRLMPASLEKITLPNVSDIKYSDTAAALAQPLNEDNVRFLNFPNSALYCPVPYYPQAFGIWLARVCGLGPAYMAYFGRFFNLLTWALLMVLALQILYFGKRIVFLLSLMPMTMYTVSTLSPDAITNALSFLFISYVLYLTFGKEQRISRVQISFLMLLSVGISLCKIVYAPMCLICFMIPFHKLGGKRRYFKTMFGVVALSLVLNLGWLAIATKFLVDNVMPGVNAAMQISNIILHPFNFLEIIWHTIFKFSNFYVQSFFGASLGWFDTPVYTWITLVYMMVLGFLVVCDNKFGVKFGKRRKLLMLGVVVIISLLIFTSLYVQWGRVSAPFVDGIQGRYFMPIILLMLYLFNNIKVRIDIKEAPFNFYLSTGLVLLQLPVLVTVMMHHL